MKTVQLHVAKKYVENYGRFAYTGPIYFHRDSKGWTKHSWTGLPEYATRLTPNDIIDLLLRDKSGKIIFEAVSG